MSVEADLPIRSYMDDPDIKWRDGKPNFDLVNEKYLKERTRQHKEGSLEKLVENLVKTWEMESTHKDDIKDWQTIDATKYKFSCNGGTVYDVADNIRLGNYNMMLEHCPLYDINREDKESSLVVFKTAFSEGFAWELLELYSGPPRVTFKWRHWSNWSGRFGDREPTGELMEMIGTAVAEVDDNLKIVNLEVYFDPNPVIAKIIGFDASKCPFPHTKS